LPASNIALSNGLLSFDTTTLERRERAVGVDCGHVDSRAKKQQVYQRVYKSDGTFADYLAGTFIWHKLHNHFHFRAVRRVHPPARQCPGRFTADQPEDHLLCHGQHAGRSHLAGSPSTSVYSTCGNVKQGMSVGWGDSTGVFSRVRPSNVTGLPNGRYNLIIEVDPQRRSVGIERQRQRFVRPVGSQRLDVEFHRGRCDGLWHGEPPTAVTVTGIVPNTMSVGSTNAVISGSGFLLAPVSVSFANGSGQVPTATNVQVCSTTTR
jgi:hypothetical protein